MMDAGREGQTPKTLPANMNRTNPFTRSVTVPGAMRVAVVHDFFETFGGAERVTAEIAAAFPDAEVHAILGRRSVAERMGVADRIHTLLPEHPRLLKHYRLLAPLYPGLIRRTRLPAADVVVSSSYAYALAMRTRNDAPQLCYCHSPIRHLWSEPGTYTSHFPGGRLTHMAFSAYAAAGRNADRRAASRVSAFITPSLHSAELIARSYGRGAEVLAPPINCDLFRPSGDPPRGYFLFAGRLVDVYKRASVVIEAFSRMPDRKLVVAGDGPDREWLQSLAGENVEFVGALEDEALVEVMQGCEAAVFPSCDDFGLIPLEVNACGRPVIALRAGGAIHTVDEGISGAYIDEPTADEVLAAVGAYDRTDYDPAAIRRHALRWSASDFRERIRAAATQVVADGSHAPAHSSPSGSGAVGPSQAGDVEGAVASGSAAASARPIWAATAEGS